MEFNKKNMTAIILILFACILFYVLMQNLAVVYGAVSDFIGIISPITAGFCVAFVLNVLLRFTEEKLFAFMAKSPKERVRKARRLVSLTVTTIFLFGIVTLVLLVVIPELRKAVTTLANKLPDYFRDLMAWVDSTLKSFNISLGEASSSEIDWDAIFDYFLDYLKRVSGIFIGDAAGATAGVISGVINTFVSLVIAIYILAQKEKVGVFFKRLLCAMLPEKVSGTLLKTCSLANNLFSSYVTGQLVEALILGLLCFIGMMIFGFPYAAVVSVVGAVTALVPVVGAFVGAAVGAFLIFTESPLQALFFLIFIVVLQQLETNIIYPRVVGTSVGLPGILVLIAVIVGGNIGGITGALIGVPVCAVLYTLLKKSLDKEAS